MFQTFDNVCGFGLQHRTMDSFDNIVERISLFVLAIIALVSHFGKGILYKRIISMMSLVFYSFGRQTIDMYIVRKM
jgi:hypothetical protein